jgi:Patatin-like phospholipase
MPSKETTPIIERFIDWLVNTAVVSFLKCVARWIKQFLRVGHLVRFSFWISVLGSAALSATSQSMEILRVVAEDSEHRFRSISLYTISALVLALMSWYWARALIYRFAPAALDRPKWEPEAIAARWLPRVCGLIVFIGIGYALWHATEGLRPQDVGYIWLMRLFLLNLVEGFLFLFGLTIRRKVADWLEPHFAFWPKKVKSSGTNKLTDLPRITWRVLVFTVILAVILFILFTTSTGEIVVASWFGTASLLLLTIAAWIAFGSFFVVYFGKLVRLPILTPLLLLAFLFSYFDLNDNHRIRFFDQPIQVQPQEFDAQFKSWWDARADRDTYKDRPYPVFIITAEGGGITAGYFTAIVLTAIQDRAPAFAQHVFAISGVSGGSIGSAVYAGLAKRCTNNLPTDQLPGQGKPIPVQRIGPLQNSADMVLKDDYLSPLLSAFLYPDLVQRFLPRPIYSWDRARALEERFETSWANHAACDWGTPPGTKELSQPFYDFFGDFPRNSIPALFFNTTNVETGERMFVTNLVPHDGAFNKLPALADVNRGLNVPFSSAACLSGRFPVVTPAGFLHDDTEGRKLRYVDGGYYENSGTATGYNILMSLLWNGQGLYDFLQQQEYKNEPANGKPVPVIIRIGFALPATRNAKDQIYQPTSEERAKYKGDGLNEVMSPVKTLLNTRGARGNDAVRQMQTAIRNLQSNEQDCSRGCMFNLELNEQKVKLPLGWLLSNWSRCVIQQQTGSISKSCADLLSGTDIDRNDDNAKQIQAIIALMTKK